MAVQQDDGAVQQVDRWLRTELKFHGQFSGFRAVILWLYNLGQGGEVNATEGSNPGVQMHLDINSRSKVPESA
jgi:hypothetical protein